MGRHHDIARRLMLTVLGGLAEFARDLIRARTIIAPPVITPIEMIVGYTITNAAKRDAAQTYQITGAFAEFERSMIRSRVNAGLARAKAQGKRLGRRPVCAEVVDRVREQLTTGAGILRTAKALGVGTGTVHRVKREMAAVAA